MRGPAPGIGLLLSMLSVACANPAKSPTGDLSEEQFKALHELRGEDAPAAEGAMIQLDGSMAYLSLPKNAHAPMPAIVVVHEWWGLNQHIRHWADRLSHEGYATLAVDLYGGKVADNRDDAMRYMRGIDPAGALAICKRAERFLREDPRVRATRTASIGWCFGGGWSLAMALEIPTLDAAIVYYGRLVTEHERLAKFHGALLGVFANRDRSIPPEDVNDFEQALEKAGVTHQILRFDANHAFANPSSARYAESSAADAWQHVRLFLQTYLARR